MLADPVPIRSEIEPKEDLEREIIDWLMKEVRLFREHTGLPPGRIALVLIGNDANEGQFTRCNSWSPEGGTRFETCSMAAMLFTQRALKDD